MQLVARVEEQVERVAQHHVVAEVARPRPGSRPLTVAFVASGTNAGVRTSPWAVRRTPARAREPASRAGSRAGASRARRARAAPALGRVRRRAPRTLRPVARCPRSPAAAARRRGSRRGAACAARAWGCGPRARRCRSAPDRVGVDALGQRQRAAERAGRALEAVVALALRSSCSALRSPEMVRTSVLELDVDVVLGQAGQVGAQHEVVVGLDEVHRGDPAARRAAVAAAAGGVSKNVLKRRFISAAAS